MCQHIPQRNLQRSFPAVQILSPRQTRIAIKHDIGVYPSGRCLRCLCCLRCPGDIRALGGLISSDSMEFIGLADSCLGLDMYMDKYFAEKGANTNITM